MRRIGGELPHALHRAIQPAEHLIPGVAKPFQFVAGLGDGKTLSEVVETDAPGGAGQFVDRGEGATAHPVSAERRDQRQQRSGANQQEAELGQENIGFGGGGRDRQVVKLALDRKMRAERPIT